MTETQLHRWVLAATGLYLLMQTLDAPLRYALHLAHLDIVLYARDLAALAAITAALLLQMAKKRVEFMFLAICLALAVHTLAGFIFISNPWQVLIGLKSMLPLVLGVAVAPYVLRSPVPVRMAIAILWITIIGVLCELFIVFPWKGLTYALALGEPPEPVNVVGSLDWTALGIPRLAGFTRASYTAASILLLSGAFVLAFSRRPVLTWISWLAGGATILLTTTKAAFLSFVVASVFFVARSLITPTVAYRLFLAVIAFMCALCIWLPVSLEPDAFHLSPYSSFIEQFMFSSFADRVNDTWPQAFDLVRHYGSQILGRGIGGFGVGQMFFETSRLNWADNLFMYCYGIFGLAGAAYMILPVVGAMYCRMDTHGFFVLLILAIFYVAGLTSGELEDTFYAFGFGMVLWQIHSFYAMRRTSPIQPTPAASHPNGARA